MNETQGLILGIVFALLGALFLVISLLFIFKKIMPLSTPQTNAFFKLKGMLIGGFFLMLAYGFITGGIK